MIEVVSRGCQFAGAVAQMQVGSNVGGSWCLDNVRQYSDLGCDSVPRDRESGGQEWVPRQDCMLG